MLNCFCAFLIFFRPRDTFAAFSRSCCSIASTVIRKRPREMLKHAVSSLTACVEKERSSDPIFRSDMTISPQRSPIRPRSDATDIRPAVCSACVSVRPPPANIFEM